MKTVTAKPSALALLVREIGTHGRDASFLANVIMCHHRKPVTKLKGLAKLLQTGHEVRTAPFDLSVLVIDGRVASWSDLENA
jgi:hypothetical protein